MLKLYTKHKQREEKGGVNSTQTKRATARFCRAAGCVRVRQLHHMTTAQNGSNPIHQNHNTYTVQVAIHSTNAIIIIVRGPGRPCQRQVVLLPYLQYSIRGTGGHFTFWPTGCIILSESVLLAADLVPPSSSMTAVSKAFTPLPR